MIQMRASNVLTSLKEALLGNVYDYDEQGFQKGLVISLDLRLYREAGGSTCKFAMVHFLFTGSTSVWMLLSDNYRWWREPLEKWKNTSNHDSCWRTDGVESPLTQMYFEWARQLDDKAAPCEMWQFNSFSMCDPVIFVKVKHERERTDATRYLRRVLEIVREGRQET